MRGVRGASMVTRTPAPHTVCGGGRGGWLIGPLLRCLGELGQLGGRQDGSQLLWLSGLREALAGNASGAGSGNERREVKGILVKGIYSDGSYEGGRIRCKGQKILRVLEVKRHFNKNLCVAPQGTLKR